MRAMMNWIAAPTLLGVSLLAASSALADVILEGTVSSGAAPHAVAIAGADVTIYQARSGAPKVLAIEVVADTDHAIETNLAQSLADAIGRVLSSPPGQTWVRVRSLPRSQYAENESPVGDGEVPVFVAVLERLPPSGTTLQAEVTALTRVIAQALNCPVACVHIEYAPAAIGRVAFGGQIVK